MKPHLPTTELFGSHDIEIHYKRPLFSSMKHISCAEDADTLLKQCINLKQLDVRECFWVILMTNANRVLAISEVATGTARGVQTNPKYIFQLALLKNASSIILAHSHPSGNLNISKRDVIETKKIQRVAKAMEITVLDHLILTSESFVSFAEENKL